MLTWASLALTLLKLVSAIMNYFNREALIKSGHDEAIAEAAAEIMKKTQAGKTILERVNALSDTDVDNELRGLEPK